MSLSRSLAQGRDLHVRAGGHVNGARAEANAVYAELQLDNHAWALRHAHAARLEWAMAVCALLAWVRYGEGES